MYIAYIYNQSGAIIAQVEEILDIEIQKKLNDISTASFALYQSNDYCKRDFLKEYRRVKLTQQIWNIEKTMFDWVIRWFDADLDKTTIKLESFEHLLSRRLLHQDFNFTSQTFDYILQTMLDHINWIYQTNITLDCGITDLTTKDYKKAETFLKTLQDLAGNWYEFVVDDLVLKFKQTIWIDRTTIWDDFVEYRFDINEPDDRSIDKIKMTVDWKELASWVIWKSWSNYSILSDPTSIWEFWLVESSFTNSWDETNATQSYLDDHKESLSEFDVSAIANDFFEADLWDLVAVYIYVWNDLMFYDGSMKVVQKRYTWGDLPKIDFTLWKTKVQSKDILEQIVDVQSRLKTLELQ